MTRRLRQPRRSTAPGQDGPGLIIGCAVILGAVAVLFVAARSSGGLPAESHYDLTVQFPSRAGALLPPKGSDVRIAGRRVGQTLRADFDRGVATLDLQLDESAGPLPADTRARVRAQGLLGAKFVDVQPGSSSVDVVDGGVLRPDHSEVTTSLSEALQAFDPSTRPALRQTIRGLGGGLAGRGGQLNEGLDGLADGLSDFRAAFGELEEDRTLAPLVRGAASAMSAFVPALDDLGPLLQAADRAARPFADEGVSLGTVLDVAPDALRQARRSLRRTTRVLTSAEQLSRAATSFTAAAPRGLTALSTLLVDGRRPLRVAAPVLRDATAAVNPTLRLTSALHPRLPQLDRTLEAARSPLRNLGVFDCDLERFGRTWRSFLNFGARGQEGPLGQLTILRTTLSGGSGVPGVPDPTGATIDGVIDPCEPSRGGRLGLRGAR